MKLYIKQIPTETRIILAGDHTPWSRVEAVTLKDRTFEHGTSAIKGKPVTIGHGYSTLAWIPEEQGSWALPLAKSYLEAGSLHGYLVLGEHYSSGVLKAPCL